MLNEAQQFERQTPMHATRDTKGLVNHVCSPEWVRYSDRMVQRQTVDLLTAELVDLKDPIVAVVGVGAGGLFEWMWKEPPVTRIGIDINHAVLMKAVGPGRTASFHPVEADALRGLPLR